MLSSDPADNPLRIRRALCALAACAAALLIAACGAGDESSDPAHGLKGEPIKVMAIDPFTVPQSGQESLNYRGAEARAAAVNAAGGIDGRPLKIIACDTQADQNKVSACARRAVAEKVVAAIGLSGTGSGVAFPILEKAGIPAIGVSAISREAATLENSFPFTGEPVLVGSAPGLFSRVGVKKLGVILPEFPEVDLAIQLLKRLATDAGIEITSVALAPLDTTDFAPVVAKSLSGGAEGVFVYFPGPNQATVIKAIKQDNPDAKVGTLNLFLTPEVLSALGSDADGLLVVSLAVPANTDVPGANKFRADLEEYANGTPMTDGVIQEWASTWMIERLLKQLDRIDAASLLKAMSKVSDFDFEGLYPPYSAGAPSPLAGFPRVVSTSTALAEVQDGELELLDPKEPFFNPFEGKSGL